MGMVRFMVYADRNTSCSAQRIHTHGVSHGDLSRCGVHHHVRSSASSSIQAILPEKATQLMVTATPSWDPMGVEGSDAVGRRMSRPRGSTGGLYRLPRSRTPGELIRRRSL